VPFDVLVLERITPSYTEQIMSGQRNTAHGLDLPCRMLVASRVQPSAVQVSDAAKPVMQEVASTP